MSMNSGDWAQCYNISPIIQFALSVAAGAVVTIAYTLCYCVIKRLAKWKKKRGE
jgi:hypothetical protein